MSSRDHPDWWRPTGGQNSQDSILERRSLIWNDDGILDGTVPGTFYTNIRYKGKFFTRGCRGMIESIQVYCDGDGADLMTLRYSPHPCLGHFGMVSIVPADGWAWQDFPVEEMWNYDSLFIWITLVSADISWAYDAVQPYDGHESDIDGDQWADMDIRPFFRVVYTGETPGDVPVSGIVNVIPIPNTSLEAPPSNAVAVPHDDWTEIRIHRGVGELVQLHGIFESAVAPAAAVEYRVRIEADGEAGIIVGNRQLTQSVIATFGRCSMGEFLQDGVYTHIWVRLPIQYRRRLRVQAYQSTGAGVDVITDIVSNELV